MLQFLKKEKKNLKIIRKHVRMKSSFSNNIIFFRENKC
jgi:hypothetical protein